MKILLVMPNLLRSDMEYSEGHPVYPPAYGIMYISSYLKSAGFDVSTLNMNHYKTDKLDQLLRRKRFDVVATGGLFTHMTKFAKILAMAKEQDRNTLTVLGGPVASAHPEFALEELKPDFLVLGEGEHTTAALLRAIGNKEDVEGVAGIGFRRNGKYIQTLPNLPIENLDELPLPDYEGFEYGAYLDHPRFLQQNTMSYLIENPRRGGIIGSRDCPGKCTFCFHVTKRKFRLRSVDNVISEIKYLIDNYGVNDIEMMDDLFSIKKSRVFEFCRKMKPLGIPWQCSLRVPGVTGELLMAMKDAGCYLVSYGFESASDKILKSMKKGIRVKQIEKVIPMTMQAKLTMQANFIFGDPAETLETAEETLRFARKYKQINLIFIRAYPGTALYYDLLKKGVIKDLRHFWIHSAFDEGGRLINMTSLSDVEFSLLRARVSLEVMKKVYFRTTKFAKTAAGEYILSIVCPLCGKVAEDLHLKNPKHVACPNCLQRAWIDPIDLSPGGRLKKRFQKAARNALFDIGCLLMRNKSIGLLTVRTWIKVKSRSTGRMLWAYVSRF